jgi:hypothetical protein
MAPAHRRETHCQRKASAKESSSFLKKRTKKLLLASVSVDRFSRINQESKSFLFLFFKKEILPCFALVASQVNAR